MPTQVPFIQLAPWMHVAGGISGHDAGTSQTIELFRRRRVAAGEYIAHNVAKRGILRQRKQDSPQVIPKRSFIFARLRLKGFEVD